MRDFFGKKKQGEGFPDTGGQDTASGQKSMFKSKGPQEMEDAGKVDSVIGPGLTVKGEIHSRGTLRVDGNVEGKIISDSSVIVGEKGMVKSDIIAGHVIIGGTVHGTVNASDKVELLSTGRLYGDVTTAPSKFVVAEGVIFEGRCSMSQSEGAKHRQPKSPRESEEKEGVAAGSKGGTA
jgi:cytoskeletal protein CcmA (bactofilin family)